MNEYTTRPNRAFGLHQERFHISDPADPKGTPDKSRKMGVLELLAVSVVAGSVAGLVVVFVQAML